MSYSVTDAGEQDMRAEMKVLDSLNDEIDQLSAQARDCGTVCPEVQVFLDVAWYFTEKTYREIHGHCSVGCKAGTHCPCCDHFKKQTNRAESAWRHIR